MEFTVITHIKGITECVTLDKNVGKYLCSPYYGDKEHFKHPGSDSESQRVQACDNGSPPPRAFLPPYSFMELKA